MERLAKVVNGFQALTIFEKRFILDAWQDSETISVLQLHLLQLLLFCVESTIPIHLVAYLQMIM